MKCIIFNNCVFGKGRCNACDAYSSSADVRINDHICFNMTINSCNLQLTSTIFIMNNRLLISMIGKKMMEHFYRRITQGKNCQKTYSREISYVSVSYQVGPKIRFLTVKCCAVCNNYILKPMKIVLLNPFQQDYSRKFII